MSDLILYRGVWPQNVGKLAKYAVRNIGGNWRIGVLYEAGAGLTYLAVEGGVGDVAARINSVKTAVGEAPGGAFYINEYRHVIVPTKSGAADGPGSHYYYAGVLWADLEFAFEGQRLTTKPVLPDGSPLKPGDRWGGPRPGIPYKLAAGGNDIYYETPALTDDEPPKVRPSMTRKVQLSKARDASKAAKMARLVAKIRGDRGGRFYVNEQGAMFTPISAGDGNGIEFVYCGQIDLALWFPEPAVGS